MYHSIMIGDKHTYYDWGLIPKTRPVFNPPVVKTQYVNVPGGDGQIDLTSTLYGEPVYDMRTGSFEFYVENGRDWTVVYSTIMGYCHGQRLPIILDDDPNYFYEGRVSVNQWRSDPNNSVIVIDALVDPYKYEVNSAGDSWLWDPFDFENGIIYTNEYTVSGTLTIDLECRRMRVSPTFTANASGMKVTFDRKTYTLPVNTAKTLLDIRLSEGHNTLVLTGTGKVKVQYRNGVL